MEEISALLAALGGADEAQAEAAVVALGRLAAAGQAEAIFAAIEPWLVADSSERRWWATRLLAELPGERAPEALIQALGDADAGVRQCAALGLRLRPVAEAVEPLVQALRDPDPLVVTLAEDALEQAGSAAVPVLLRVLETGSYAVRLEAIRALAAIGDPQAIPALYAALDEDSALMEYFASQGLEKMGVGMVFFRPE